VGPHFGFVRFRQPWAEIFEKPFSDSVGDVTDGAFLTETSTRRDPGSVYRENL
jgi:hypothetical protein